MRCRQSRAKGDAPSYDVAAVCGHPRGCSRVQGSRDRRRSAGNPGVVNHTWRSSSDKTGHDSSSSSFVSASGAGVSVTEMSGCWSPSATRWAVYHPGALTKREPGATPRGRARQPLLGFLGGLAARAPRPRRRLPSASLSPQQRGTRLPQTGAAEQVLPFVAGRQTPPGAQPARRRTSWLLYVSPPRGAKVASRSSRTIPLSGGAQPGRKKRRGSSGGSWTPKHLEQTDAAICSVPFP